jgi:hypothetical protein
MTIDSPPSPLSTDYDSSAAPAPFSAGDLWHDRLTQFAHRCVCVAALVVAAAYGAPDKLPHTLAVAIALYAAILAIVSSACAAFLIRPEDDDVRESLGVLICSLLPLAAGLWRVHSKELLVGEYLKSWLALGFGPSPWPWICRAALILLVLWVGITTALTRRGRE